MKRKITKRDLAATGACMKDTKKFIRLFPDGAEITLENLKKAENAGLDVEWLVLMGVTGAKLGGHTRRKNRIRRDWFSDGVRIPWEDMRQKIQEEQIRVLREGWSPKKSS